jgi:hypothetical protein
MKFALSLTLLLLASPPARAAACPSFEGTYKIANQDDCPVLWNIDPSLVDAPIVGQFKLSADGKIVVRQNGCDGIDFYTGASETAQAGVRFENGHWIHDGFRFVGRDDTRGRAYNGRWGIGYGWDSETIRLDRKHRLIINDARSAFGIAIVIPYILHNDFRCELTPVAR